MKVCFETFGCRLNKAEALQMEANYLAANWTVTTKHSDADLIIVRGCSVTSHAQHECERLIAHLRRHYPHTPIKACGCLPNRSSFTALPAALTEKAVPTRTARAYLKVQDGCAGKCTFCIVPKYRGESKSEDFTALVDRAKRFIDAGYHEIVVTGCNLSLYASQGKRLPDLLAALAELTPATSESFNSSTCEFSSCRIRLGSVEPGACALETIQAMASHPNVCRFLHLPVQSGSSSMLLAMCRPYTIKDVEEAACLAKKLMPTIGLGCDLMTGFPGETNLDFSATKTLLSRLPFSNAHIFPYSQRPGTPAANFPGLLPRSIRSARAHDLGEIIRLKRKAFANTFAGKTVEVLVEDERHGHGWTGEYLPCKILGSNSTRKSLVRVRITKVEEDQLLGQPR